MQCRPNKEQRGENGKEWESSITRQLRARHTRTHHNDRSRHHNTPQNATPYARGPAPLFNIRTGAVIMT